MEGLIFAILRVLMHKPFNEVSDRSHNFLLLPFFFLLFQRIWFNSSNTTHISNTKHYNCRIQEFLITQNLCAKTCTRIQTVSPSGTRVAMVTYSHDPHLDFSWHEFFNMECTLKAISSIR